MTHQGFWILLYMTKFSYDFTINLEVTNNNCQYISQNSRKLLKLPPFCSPWSLGSPNRFSQPFISCNQKRFFTFYKHQCNFLINLLIVFCHCFQTSKRNLKSQNHIASIKYSFSHVILIY